MFERFTDRARRVLVVAQEEAERLGHNFLGTEHVLLGLLEGEGVAAKVLRAQGFTADDVRRQVVEIIGRGAGAADTSNAEALATIGIDLDEVTAAVEEAFGPGALDRAATKRRKRFIGGAPPFTPRVKKQLELSLREALSLGHSYIGTEHMLLGAVRLGGGVAYEVLRTRMDPATLRDAVIDELKRLRPGA